MSTPLQELLHKEMTRKQFLTDVGIILLGFMGIGPILKLVFGKHMPKPQIVSTASSTYGHRPPS